MYTCKNDPPYMRKYYSATGEIEASGHTAFYFIGNFLENLEHCA